MPQPRGSGAPKGKEAGEVGAFDAAVAAGPLGAVSAASAGAPAFPPATNAPSWAQAVGSGHGRRHGRQSHAGGGAKARLIPGLRYRDGQANPCPQAVQDGAPRGTGEWPQRWQA